MKSAVHDRDTLTAELNALATIGRALQDLDPATRARVLRWTMDRFDVTTAGTHDSTPAGKPRGPQPAPAETDPLAVDSLEDMFEGPVHREQTALPPAKPQATESLLKAFVTEFNQLVVEWQGA